MEKSFSHQGRELIVNWIGVYIGIPVVHEKLSYFLYQGNLRLLGKGQFAKIFSVVVHAYLILSGKLSAALGFL